LPRLNRIKDEMNVGREVVVTKSRVTSEDRNKETEKDIVAAREDSRCSGADHTTVYEDASTKRQKRASLWNRRKT